MALYPIKMLKDEEGLPFVPLVGTESIRDPDGKTLEERLSTKLGPDNLKGGTNVSITTEGDNCFINVNFPASNLINNLTTAQPNQGALDAYQGKVLKGLIPTVADNLTTTDATKALSAYQGYLLKQQIDTMAGDKTFYFTQSSPTDIWFIQHNLNKYRAVAIIDSAGTEVIGEVTYVDLNNIKVVFNGAFAGSATLN